MSRIREILSGVWGDALALLAFTCVVIFVLLFLVMLIVGLFPSDFQRFDAAVTECETSERYTHDQCVQFASNGQQRTGSTVVIPMTGGR